MCGGPASAPRTQRAVGLSVSVTPDPGATNEVRIVRRSGSYVLIVDPMVVDLHRFTQLITQAQAADADQGASTLFAQALGLWQGEAFDGLDTPWINAVRDTVSQQRLAAELERNDRELRLGHHTELLSELVTGAATHPLDDV